MKIINIKLILTLILWFGVNTIQFIANGTNTSQHKVVDGIFIYLGVLPVEIIEGPIDQSIHDGLPVGLFRYHVTVTLFDENNI